MVHSSSTFLRRQWSHVGPSLPIVCRAAWLGYKPRGGTFLILIPVLETSVLFRVWVGLKTRKMANAHACRSLQMTEMACKQLWSSHITLNVLYFHSLSSSLPPAQEPIVEILYSTKAIIGEGPFYEEETNQLLWVDINGQTVNFLNLDTKQNRCASELACWRSKIRTWVSHNDCRFNYSWIVINHPRIYSSNLGMRTVWRCVIYSFKLL